MISDSVFKPFQKNLLAEKDTVQENDLFMATFATLILMRKLDLEKSVYNLRLCEWRQEEEATQKSRQQRKQSAHWEMARCYCEKVHSRGGTCGVSWFSLWEMDSAFMHIYLELILVMLLHNTERQQVRKNLRMGLELDVLSTQGIHLCAYVYRYMYRNSCIRVCMDLYTQNSISMKHMPQNPPVDNWSQG